MPSALLGTCPAPHPQRGGPFWRWSRWRPPSSWCGSGVHRLRRCRRPFAKSYAERLATSLHSPSCVRQNHAPCEWCSSVPLWEHAGGDAVIQGGALSMCHACTRRETPAMSDSRFNEAIDRPIACPFCQGKRIDTLAKAVTVTTVWRCRECDGTWTIASRAVSTARSRSTF